ncbi:MAG: calcium-binding protein [Janthinobacterium lividum]
MANLSNGNVLGFASVALMLSGIATGGLGGLLSTALGYFGSNVDQYHPMSGMEHTMYIAAGLEKALGAGVLRMKNVPLSEATGEMWHGDVDEPGVLAFQDANYQVKAYIQRTGQGWTLSTPDQQTRVTLAPSSVAGQAPLCLVKEPGKPLYACVVTEQDGALIRRIDNNLDGRAEQLILGIDANRDGQLDVFIDSGTTQSNLLNADLALHTSHEQGVLSDQVWNDYVDWSTSQLVDTDQFFTVPDYIAPDFSPIGAFYESSSRGTDLAPSIADKTFRILNTAGSGVTLADLMAHDIDADGKLADHELDGLMAWSDLNEDGIRDQRPDAANEFTSLMSALGSIGLTSLQVRNYLLHTAGNAAQPMLGNPAAAPIIVLAPWSAAPSDYVQQRYIYDRFHIDAETWIDWTAREVKVSEDRQSLVGTDGNDNFDIDYYREYDGRYFNLGLIKNFYGGNGDDVVGGSMRNDNLWGDAGNDSLVAYDGDDALAGGEGLDELQGQLGNDLLDGGTGDDRLFGGVGNDVLTGGDGDDLLLGFAESNDARQTLQVGESDNDLLFGGNGADRLSGSLGNDYLDGGDDADLILGDEGEDILFGGHGDDELNGGAGADILEGWSGNDKMFGGVGNDRLWGGDGNDIMLGFKPVNETPLWLGEGETDEDILYGGAGSDLIFGGVGHDQLWGGADADELRGGTDDDMLYGEDGNDKLFGGAGNDTLYGGGGNDVIVGGAAINQEALDAGVPDNNFLYGGNGDDTLLGGGGQDYLDGGAGADEMEGGRGDDYYLVNSVNDSILEQQNEGFDTVVSSANTILGANIEQLNLVEGYRINGTGNRLDNRLFGNSQDNILDGVTGADWMVGGLGNDTYYIDNAGDRTFESSGEGIDTVNASISHVLGANIENLNLLDFSKPESGMADGVPILVYGYPKAFELDYMQGNAVAGFKGTCALTAIANLSTQASEELSEEQVVRMAIDNSWCMTDAQATDYQRGGSNYVQQQALLDRYGIRNGIVMGYNEQAIANLIKGGRGVILGVNCGKLWADGDYLDDGRVNHVVTVTGVANDVATGAINGFYMADSGRGRVSDMTRYVSLADFRTSANVASAYAIYTVEPIKLWEENINASGNDLDNLLTGNRGNNVLAGGRGNDTLAGGGGNDTYVFSRGDGQDTVIDNDNDNDAGDGNADILVLQDIRQSELSFSQVGNDLQINVMGASDRICVQDWFAASIYGTNNRIETIQTSDGQAMLNAEIDRLIEAMASFAPPPPVQTDWHASQSSTSQILLTTPL